MANDKKQNEDITNKKEDDEYYFKVWKKYEGIAMHFNDLIIRLRIQSIGGIAALATIIGIILKGTNGNNERFNYGLAILATICLMLFWVAIWILDIRYYNRLLEGSVNAILKLEKNKNEFLVKKEINLSTNIERAFDEKFEHEKKGAQRIYNSRNGFYICVLIALIIVLISNIYMFFLNDKQKEITTGINQKAQNASTEKNLKE